MCKVISVLFKKSSVKFYLGTCKFFTKASAKHFYLQSNAWEHVKLGGGQNFPSKGEILAKGKYPWSNKHSTWISIAAKHKNQHLSFSLSLSLSFSIYLSVSLSLSLSIYLSFNLFVYLSLSSLIAFNNIDEHWGLYMLLLHCTDANLLESESIVSAGNYFWKIFAKGSFLIKCTVEYRRSAWRERYLFILRVFTGYRILKIQWQKRKRPLWACHYIY